MPNRQSQDEQSQDKSKTNKPSTLPQAMEKRLSLKWLTLQALDVAIQRLKAQGAQPRVTILTAFGEIEGELQEIRSSYAESFIEDEEKGQLEPDIASMVTHLRSELLRTYEQAEPQIDIVDTAPILSLRNVVLRGPASRRRAEHLPQLTLFADQVIGFALTDVPVMH